MSASCLLPGLRSRPRRHGQPLTIQKQPDAGPDHPMRVPNMALWQLNDAVKSVRETGGIGIKKAEHASRRRVGAQVDPIRQIGGSLQHIARTLDAGKVQLKRIIRQGLGTGEINRRLNVKQGRGSHTINQVGFKCIGLHGDAIGQRERAGVEQRTSGRQGTIQRVIEGRVVVGRYQADLD